MTQLNAGNKDDNSHSHLHNTARPQGSKSHSQTGQPMAQASQSRQTGGKARSVSSPPRRREKSGQGVLKASLPAAQPTDKQSLLEAPEFYCSDTAIFPEPLQPVHPSATKDTAYVRNAAFVQREGQNMICKRSQPIRKD